MEVKSSEKSEGEKTIFRRTFPNEIYSGEKKLNDKLEIPIENS